jgi:6-pyruvoyltetrahydropterin/6-carboxytetrahydropterin synthase
VTSPARHRIFVGQDQHKFSVAHMTVFPDGQKEKLHGHNFNVTVALELETVGFETLLDLGIVKKAVEAQCREWNEHLLLGTKNPKLELLRTDGEVEFRLCGKRYLLPAEDVVLLPVDNVIVENLSIEFARRVVERLGAETLRAARVSAIQVEVREASGQGGSYTWMFAGDSTDA